MKLYAANATHQIQQITYWLPETPRSIVQEIPMGGQIVVANKDLSSEVVDSIVEQNRRFGWRTIREVGSPNFSGIVYSTDRPVSYSDLLEIVNKRRMQLAMQGKKMREEAAIATDVAINDTFNQNEYPSRLRQLDMSVEEVSRDQRDTSPEISEGIRVSHLPDGATNDSPTRRGRARAARRTASQ